MQKLFYILNSFLVVALLTAYLSPYVNPNITWFFSIFGLFYIIILYTNIAFIIFWLVVKPKYAWISIIGIFIGWGSLVKNIGFNNSGEGTEGLSIMTYNIGKTRFEMTDENAQEKIKDFKKLISSADPDIICIQERVNRHMGYYEQIFSDYSLYADDDLGTAIYSKYPVINNGNIPFDTKAHNGTWADVVYETDTIRIYAIHLSSNHVTKVTDEMLDKPDIRKKKTWGNFRYVLSKYNKHAKIRVGQLEQVLAHAKKSPYRNILTGDFNDIPQSYVYNLISREYRDAFRDRGSGIQKTFNSAIPGLRIDYTFVDEGITVLSQKLIKSKLSDHYPLLTNIDLAN